MQKHGRFWMICLTCLLGFAVPLMAGTIQKFRAEQVIVSPDGQIRAKSKIYSMPEKLRLEMNHPSGQGTMIMRRDKQVYWILSPENKRYTEHPLNEAEWEKAKGDFLKAQDIKELGTETVQGFRCQKRRVTTTVEVMGVARTSTSTIWSSSKIDFPLRTKSQSGQITELRNIKKGDQPDALFETPAGFTRVSSMMELGRPRMAPKTASTETEQDGSSLKLPSSAKMPDWLKKKIKAMQQ